MQVPKSFHGFTLRVAHMCLSVYLFTPLYTNRCIQTVYIKKKEGEGSIVSHTTYMERLYNLWLSEKDLLESNRPKLSDRIT